LSISKLDFMGLNTDLSLSVGASWSTYR
jgi:hypothetical protein